MKHLVYTIVIWHSLLSIPALAAADGAHTRRTAAYEQFTKLLEDPIYARFQGIFNLIEGDVDASMVTSFINGVHDEKGRLIIDVATEKMRSEDQKTLIKLGANLATVCIPWLKALTASPASVAAPHPVAVPSLFLDATDSVIPFQQSP